jgi:hypothetical protein
MRNLIAGAGSDGGGNGSGCGAWAGSSALIDMLSRRRAGVACSPINGEGGGSKPPIILSSGTNGGEGGGGTAEGGGTADKGRFKRRGETSFSGSSLMMIVPAT